MDFVFCDKLKRKNILGKIVISNKLDESTMKAILKKSIDASFVDSEMETLYQAYAWKHFRRLYSIAGLLLLVFTIYLSATMTFISQEARSNTLLLILIGVSFLIQILLMSFWKTEQEPKYLNILMSLLAISMGAIYVVIFAVIPSEYHETLIIFCFINSLGMIFLSNGRLTLMAINIIILILPINISIILHNDFHAVALISPVYFGLIAFLVYLDNYSRRITRLNWYRQKSMDALNEEMTQIAHESLEEKSRIEEAAAQNVHLIEQIFEVNEEMEKKNQFLNNLIEGIPLGIIVLDDKTNVLANNKKTLELLNLDKQEGLFDNGKSLKIIIDALRQKEGHHSPRFWASYDEIMPLKMNPKKGKSPTLIKSDFHMENGTFISFIEVPISSGQNILITQDITYRKEIEAEMRKQALTDSLTGLANRHAFDLKFEDAIERNHRNKTSLGLAMIDLDRFKPINDTHGHPVGDKILQYVGNAIKELVRTTDLPCRLGGDEFAILFSDISADKPPTLACNRILEALNKKIQIDDLELDLGASIGLTFSNSPEINSDQLIDEADKALYRAKEAGRGALEVVQTTL